MRLSCRILGLRPLNHRLQLLNGDVLMVVPRATSYVFIREVCSKTFSYPKPMCSQLLHVWKTLVLSQGFSLCERVRVFSMCCYGATGTGREKKPRRKRKLIKCRSGCSIQVLHQVDQKGFQTYQPAAEFSERCSLCAAFISTYSFLKALCDSGLAVAESSLCGSGSAIVGMTATADATVNRTTDAVVHIITDAVVHNTTDAVVHSTTDAVTYTTSYATI